MVRETDFSSASVGDKLNDRCDYSLISKNALMTQTFNAQVSGIWPGSGADQAIFDCDNRIVSRMDEQCPLMQVRRVPTEESTTAVLPKRRALADPLLTHCNQL